MAKQKIIKRNKRTGTGKYIIGRDGMVVINQVKHTDNENNQTDNEFNLENNNCKTEDSLMKNKEKLNMLIQLAFKLSAEKSNINDENFIIDVLNKSNIINEIYNKKIKKLNNENNKLKEIIYSNATTYDSDVKIQQIPIDIYLDINEPQIIFKVYEAILSFIESIEFEIVFEFEEKKGSWIKRILAQSIKVMTHKEVTDRLKEIEYAVEVNTVLKNQAEIDKNQSEALLNILKSVENVPNAIIRIGSLLVVKLTNLEGSVNVQVRSLSIKEMHLLNKKPELLSNPQTILKALTKEINENDSTTQTNEN